MNLTKPQRKTALLNSLMALGALIVCVVTAVISIMPQTYDVKQGEISPETITAPEDFIDEAGTQHLIEEAQAKVGAVYSINPEITQQSLQKTSEDFAAFEQVRAYAQGVFQDKETQTQQAVQAEIDEAVRKQDEAAKAQAAAEAAAANASASPQETATPEPTPTPVPVPTPYEVQEFDAHAANWQEILGDAEMNAMREMLPAYTDDTDILTLVSMTESELSNLKNEIVATVQQELQKGVMSDDATDAKQRLATEVSRSLRLSAAQDDLAYQVIDEDFYPNMDFDEEATQQKKDEASAAVEPVVYKKGQNIVLKGNPVTPEQYNMLKDRGLLATEKASTRPYWAVIIYIVMLFLMYAMFLAIFNKALLTDRKKIGILSILTALAYVTTTLAQMVAVHIFPIVLFVILGAVLLSPKNALVYSVFLSLLLTSVTTDGREFLSRDSLILLLMMLPGSFFAIYTLKDMRYRSRLIVAGLAAAAPAVVIEYICWLLRIVNTQQMFIGMAMITGSGLICGIASIGVLPIIESAFHLTTPTKLLELSDPNHPLTKRLMVEAPGTYHHSMLVANLAESGCNAIGGFSLLARVGAYFHDVGKLANPLYFKENQTHNFNPHDMLSPKESSAILKKHVPDGVEMLKKSRMPKEIIKIAAEHHGNSLTGYFYAQAMNEGGEVNIEDFRYEGEPPSTKEGAVIMLADIVEAAVRSLDSPSREQIEDTVHKLIRERYDDGQLDNAPLNRSDLNKITEAFTNLFSGVYHSRIKYPEIRIHGAGNEDRII